jgi:hypothetical protein
MSVPAVAKEFIWSGRLEGERHDAGQSERKEKEKKIVHIKSRTVEDATK